MRVKSVENRRLSGFCNLMMSVGTMHRKRNSAWFPGSLGKCQASNVSLSNFHRAEKQPELNHHEKRWLQLWFLWTSDLVCGWCLSQGWLQFSLKGNERSLSNTRVYFPLKLKGTWRYFPKHMENGIKRCLSWCKSLWNPHIVFPWYPFLLDFLKTSHIHCFQKFVLHQNQHLFVPFSMNY